MSNNVIIPPDLKPGAQLSQWAKKNGLNYDEVKAIYQAGSFTVTLPTQPNDAPDESPAAQFTDVDPKNDLKREYVFTVDAKSPQAGRDLDLKIAGVNAPWVSHLNNGSKYIHFRGYRFATRSKGIRDFLRAGIASGVFDMIKEDVQVTVRCAVPNCTFVSSQRGSLGQQELTAHFMANHAGTGDEDGED